MKSINKILFFVFSCITFTNVYCFYNDGNNAWRGAAIGGLAGGRKGAAIGLGVGAFSDIASNRRRRYDDEDNYYYNKRRKYLSNNKRRTSKQSYQDLQAENEELRRQLDENENN